MKTKYDKKSKILKALSHPLRLKLVVGLYKDKCSVGVCQKKMGLPQSTISQYLNTLKNAGIIMGERRGTAICYEVIDEFAKKIIKILINKEDK